MIDEKRIQLLIDKQDIYELLCRYARKKYELSRSKTKEVVQVYDKIKNKNNDEDRKILALLGRTYLLLGEYDSAVYFSNASLQEYTSSGKFDEGYYDVINTLAFLEWGKNGINQKVISSFIKIAENDIYLFTNNIEGSNEGQVGHLKVRLSNCRDILFSLLMQKPSNNELSSEVIKVQVLFKGFALKRFSKMKDNENHLQNDFKKVISSLGTKETAIDFVRFIDIENDSTTYAAFLMNPNMPPLFIPLFKESELTNLIFDSGRLKSAQNLYCSELNIVRKNFTKNKYSLAIKIWGKLIPHLNNTETIYFSPDGELSLISMPSLLYDDNYLGNKYHFVPLLNIVDVNKIKKDNAFRFQTYDLIGAINYEREKPISSDSNLQRVYDAMNKLNEISDQSDSLSMFDNSYGYLYHSDTEIHEINQLLKSKRKTLISYLTGTNVNKDTFIHMQNNQPDILHISTHAFYFPPYHDELYMSSTEPKFSADPMERCGFALSHANGVGKLFGGGEKGIINGKEIASMNLTKTKLVVLSGCETGRGRLEYGEGVMGLQRAFRMAGVQYILVNLYDIEDAEAEKFVKVFYARLLEEPSIEKALEGAQHSFKNTYKNSTSWAGWILLR